MALTMTTEAAFLTTELLSPAPGAQHYARARVTCNNIAQRESPILQAELIAAAQRANHRILVDLTDVTMITSVGLGALITLHKACKEAKGKFILVNLKPDILSILKLSRLDRLFTIADSEPKAIKAFA